MNDALLIQHCSGNSPHINLLKITATKNLEYCMRHKFDFSMVINGERPVTGHWDAVRLVREAMDLPYKYIVYLDADAIIVDMEHDLRKGCPEGKIGACRHILTNPPFSMELDHLNVGVLYYSNCQETRDFVDKWLDKFPGTPQPAWWEQGAMNDINDGTVVEIDAKYNSTFPVNHVENPVVSGFHGRGDVRTQFDLMVSQIK